jgi:hypothetical protein
MVYVSAMRTIVVCVSMSVAMACAGAKREEVVVTLPPPAAPTQAPSGSDAAPEAPPAIAMTTDASLGGFDRAAAASSLVALSNRISECKMAGGPVGPGHVKVVFGVDGIASRVDVDTPPYQGTPTGECIRQLFSNARVPPYAGQPTTVGKSIFIQ